MDDAVVFTRLCAFLQYPAEQIAESLVESYGGGRDRGGPPGAARCPEWDIELDHLVAEHEAAIAAEWEGVMDDPPLPRLGRRGILHRR